MNDEEIFTENFKVSLEDIRKAIEDAIKDNPPKDRMVFMRYLDSDIVVSKKYRKWEDDV